MKRRGRGHKLVDLSLKDKTNQNEKPKKTKQYNKKRKTSPVPKGNEKEVSYLLNQDILSSSDDDANRVCASKKVSKISTLTRLPSLHNEDIKCDTPLAELQNVLNFNTTSPSKSSIAQELCTNIENIVSENGPEVSDSQEGILGTAIITTLQSNPLYDNPTFASTLQTYNIVENVVIEECISLPNELVTENKKPPSPATDHSGSLERFSSCSESLLSTKENIPIDLTNQQPVQKEAEQDTCTKYENILAPGDVSSIIVNVDVAVTGQLTLTYAEEGTCSKPASPSLIKDASPSLIKDASPSRIEDASSLPSLLIPDIENTTRSETNKEPIQDDQYPNLSIQSADIVLDSPGSSFCIPSPYSSVNSPVVFTNKKKRNSEKIIRPGKVRTTNITEWIDVKRKVLKNLGQRYANRKGDVKDEKKIKPPCHSKCIKKCNEKIDESQRKYIFKCYWELGSHERQWDFISKYVSSHEPKRIKAKGPNRSRVMKYTLPKSTKESVTVCRVMFLNTLSISEKTVRTLFDKQNSANENVHQITDLRGKHRNRPKKLCNNILNSVKEHINTLAPVESHYCRKSSTKKYLDGQLSYKRLHLLYLEWFDEQIYGTQKATLRQYQDIVNSNFNIAFYTPKKDQCDKCHAYKNIKEPTAEQKSEHDIHLNYKTLARSIKEIDKSEAEKSKDREIVTACFDMQKILTCPFGNVSIFYYKRKLNLYNFTVYDMAQKTGYCYMWSEVNGKKGANEICSGLILFMESKISEGVKQFRFWSDNCSGQNRNRIVFALYQYIVGKYDVESITHKFLEVGHTQNEGDSVHSVIEGASNNMTIYTPDQWFNLIRWAKTTGEAYRVKEMTINDILDCRVLLGGKNWTKNDDNEKVAWSKVKEIHVSKENANIVKYKYQLDEEYKEITTLKKKTRGKANDVTVNIEQANTSLLKIKNDKYKDLKYLCESKIIPEEFHSYFKSLACDQAEGNRRNESDDDNSEED